MKSCRMVIVLLIFSHLFITGCLKDEELPVAHFEIDNAAELLIYLEAKGDYINNTPDFSLIDASEVYGMLNRFFIIDIRSAEEYINGHIEGAVNLRNSQILDHLNDINILQYDKIVLVSSSGQAASYYSTLLRIYGYSNIYSLKWGMASWNDHFSDNWNIPINTPYSTILFNNIMYENNEQSPLPTLTYENPGSSIESKLEERVRLLLNDEFSEDTNLRTVSDAAIGLSYLSDLYDSQAEEFPGYYIACIVDEALYFFGSTGTLGNPGHPPTTILYKSLMPFSEMRSNKFLQTMPTDKTIILYGYSGQYSAAITAYLRLLGYDAKSVLYGYNRMHYSRMMAYPVFSPYTYGEDKTGNYPYITE